jgi:pullulanase/glycogen debranching enzyme
VFNKQGRKPWASVNFVTAHDGFTLNDLVCYNQKHNEANSENNQDGMSNNRSWNCGVEGPTDDKAINAMREKQMRNFLATLLLAHGDGRAQTTGLREKGSDATVLLLFNAHHEKIRFTMPATIEGDQWRLLLDTSKNSRTAGKVIRPGETRFMADHSMAAYVMQRATEGQST